MAQSCQLISCERSCNSMCGYIPNDVIFKSIETNRNVDQCDLLVPVVAENIGATVPVFASQTGGTIQFNSLIGGVDTILVSAGGEIEISSTSEANGGQNLGGGSEVFAQKSGPDLQFRTLTEGTNVTLTQTATEIEIATSSAGEVNTASNLGAGEGVFANKSGVDFEFKSLVAGADVTLTPSATEIEIARITSSLTMPITATDGTPTQDPFQNTGGFAGFPTFFIGNCTDSAGTVRGANSSPPGGSFRVIFSAPLATTPVVVITPAHPDVTAISTTRSYVEATTTHFDIFVTTSLSSASYIFNYFVIQLQP